MNEIIYKSDLTLKIKEMSRIEASDASEIIDMGAVSEQTRGYAGSAVEWGPAGDLRPVWGSRGL